MDMHYKLTVKKSLDTVAEGTINLTFDPGMSLLDNRHMDQDALDQMIFDLELAFNSRPDLKSNRLRLHIERAD